jgi:hypothetical protein
MLLSNVPIAGLSQTGVKLFKGNTSSLIPATCLSSSKIAHSDNLAVPWEWGCCYEFRTVAQCLKERWRTYRPIQTFKH